MTLIPHQYGHDVTHSRMYLISTTHSSLISSSFILCLRICPRLPGYLTAMQCLGTLQADASLCTARRFPESLADYNLESILCSSAEIRIIIPLGCSWRKIRYNLIHSYKGSLRTKTDTAHRIRNQPLIRFLWNYGCFFLLYTVLLPSVLALMLSRYYPWERTCNADM